MQSAAWGAAALPRPPFPAAIGNIHTHTPFQTYRNIGAAVLCFGADDWRWELAALRCR